MTSEILLTYAMTIKELWIAQFCAEFLNKGDDTIGNGFELWFAPPL